MILFILLGDILEAEVERRQCKGRGQIEEKKTRIKQQSSTQPRLRFNRSRSDWSDRLILRTIRASKRPGEAIMTTEIYRSL